jgi:hypothetical protein
MLRWLSRFPQSLQEKFGITDLSIIMPKLFHSTSFLIHYSLRDIENIVKYGVGVARYEIN